MSPEPTGNGTARPKNDLRFFLLMASLAVPAVWLSYSSVPVIYTGLFLYGITTIAITSNDFPQTFASYQATQSNTVLNKIFNILVFGAVLWTVHSLFYFYFEPGEIHCFKLDGYPEAQSFTLVQALTPILVIIASRFRFPLSTSFAVLTVFSVTSANSFELTSKMIVKSLNGYVIAYICAVAIWLLVVLLERYLKKKGLIGESSWLAQSAPGRFMMHDQLWKILQLITTMSLWAVWLMQDTANSAVFLPRQLPLWLFLIAVSIYMIALTVILWREGGEMQGAVEEHHPIPDAKSATLVDAVYAVILFVFLVLSNTPMSTTFVFFGLLAGRHTVLNRVRSQGSIKSSLWLAFKYFFKSSAAMVSALILAVLGTLYGILYAAPALAIVLGVTWLMLRFIEGRIQPGQHEW